MRCISIDNPKGSPHNLQQQMWSYRTLYRIDFRVIPILLMLGFMSLLILASHSGEGVDELFFTPLVKSQMEWFAIGTVVFIFFAGFDYHHLREWTWILYGLTLLALVGLFFTDSIQNVHRWYRVPFVRMSIQPSEYAKLVVVIALSWFLERRKTHTHLWSTVFLGVLVVAVPFLLILRQPDLGTALVLFPITLVMFYIGDIRPSVVKMMTWVTSIILAIVAVMFLGLVPHESVRPIATTILKDYQFDRLSPNTHHQKAAATAIAIGGLSGTGWHQSEYSTRGWLPAPYTDSVFPAFGEEFGLIGLLVMMALFYTLIYFSFQVTAAAKDDFGRLLAAGLTVYLAIHMLMNIGMMCGFLPITGVPLILITYGGSSVLSTMIALGILQSIHSRRFMF